MNENESNKAFWFDVTRVQAATCISHVLPCTDARTRHLLPQHFILLLILASVTLFRLSLTSASDMIRDGVDVVWQDLLYLIILVITQFNYLLTFYSAFHFRRYLYLE